MLSINEFCGKRKLAHIIRCIKAYYFSESLKAVDVLWLGKGKDGADTRKIILYCNFKRNIIRYSITQDSQILENAKAELMTLSDHYDFMMNVVKESCFFTEFPEYAEKFHAAYCELLQFTEECREALYGQDIFLSSYQDVSLLVKRIERSYRTEFDLLYNFLADNELLNIQ